MLIIKNKDEVPLASFAEGHCKGIIQKIKAGNFIIQRTIELPRILCCGDFIIDVYMHHPMVEWQLKAPHCAEIHSDGYQEGMGHALNLKENGIIGLETKNE